MCKLVWDGDRAFDQAGLSVGYIHRGDLIQLNWHCPVPERDSDGHRIVYRDLYQTVDHAVRALEKIYEDYSEEDEDD